MAGQLKRDSGQEPRLSVKSGIQSTSISYDLDRKSTKFVHKIGHGHGPQGNAFIECSYLSEADTPVARTIW